MNAEKLKPLARDLRKTPPRSPRETLGGFVIAARMLDKARADVLGINVYPMFSWKILRRRHGRLRIEMPYARATLVDRLLALYYERYGLPMLISETASRGSVTRRRAWLAESIEAAARARARRIPLIGYTWWPMFALVRWAYLRGRRPTADYLEQMGLWDLEPTTDGRLRRVETALVDDFRTCADASPESARRPSSGAGAGRAERTRRR